MEHFYGETKCQCCNNNAYYYASKKYLCGVHSRKLERVPLEKNPKHAEYVAKKLKTERQEIKEAAEKNKEEGKEGKVIITKMRIMKSVEYVNGFLKVFPNFRHQNRKDGFGCKSLSPMSLGPVEHNMKCLPPSRNIENFHQFAKIYKFETDKEKSHELRVAAYESIIPHRHKFKTKEPPLYSLYYDKEGNERHYTYVQSRYFYCYWYEKLAKATDDFKKLCEMKKNGTNLQIVGYDGYMPDKDLYEHYIDGSRSFGHELVLYTMITVKNSKDYPWNVYYQKNNEIYKNVI